MDRVPEEFHDPIHHQALAFDYFAEAYIAFFHGADIFEEQDKVLEARYGMFVTPSSDLVLSSFKRRKMKEW